MANIDKETPVTSDATKEETGIALLPLGTAAGAIADNSLEVTPSSSLETSGQDSQSLHSGGDVAVSLFSTNLSGGPSSSVNVSQPKRFSAVNINKKFLEKNSSAVGAAQMSSNSVTTKSGSTASRPVTQTPPTHSRLVTTKLTTTSQSSAAGSGWSRPPSATPPVSSISSPGPISNAPVVTSPTSLSSAPQLPHAGKVIQPQPRTVVASSSKAPAKDGTATSSKPAWGNTKAAAAALNSSAGNKERDDFPTAAEGAQASTSSKKAKPSETKQVTDTPAASYNQSRMEAADTFRGVHLDPNAHHWDEMSEDDDNFLGGVIEFGDGRQYTVQSLPQSSSPPPEESKSGGDTGGNGSTTQATILVSKEERFGDDFDRSWPRSKPSPVPSQQDVPVAGHHAISLPAAPSHHVSSAQETSSRVLFNERSNKLEPYSNAHPPYRTNQGPFSMRRGNHSESTSPTDIRNTRDLPSHSQSMQLLQKTGTGQGHPHDFPSRPRGSSASFGTGASHNERQWGGEAFRRDTMSASGTQHDSRRNRDQYNSFGLPPPSPVRDRDNINDTRAPRSSTMGPPSLPAPPLRGHKDGGRQLPPHLPHAHPPTYPGQRSLSAIDSLTSPVANKELGLSPGSSSSLLPPHSPAVSHVPLTSPGFTSPSTIAGFSEADIEEVRKDVMQTGAARAKERRKREEEEREKEKERARKKAAELEEMMKAVGTNKQAIPNTEDTTIIDFIEDAARDGENRQKGGVSSTNSGAQRAPSHIQPIGAPSRRPPSLKGLPRPSVDHPRQTLPRRMSQTSSGAPTSVPTQISQADSWRSKVNPSISATARQGPQSTSVFPEQPSAFKQDYMLTPDVEEDLEVVDFSDLGRFVGETDTLPNPAQKSIQVSNGPIFRPARPVASDFFQDPVETALSADPSPWRRRDADRDQSGPVENETSLSTELSSMPAPIDVEPLSAGVRPPSASLPASFSKEVNTSEYQASANRYGTTVSYGQQRTPRSPAFHKEADLSAWDDAMSRIKGALDGMQTTELSKAQGSATDTDLSTCPAKPAVVQPPNVAKAGPPKEPRWIPPALRVRHSDLDIQSREEFSMEETELSSSWSASYVVRFPSSSRFLEQPSRKQLHLSRLPVHLRWDILSWDPPVEGMNRRDFSINDVLFRKPVNKGKPRYRVLLPRSRLRPAKGPGAGPRVHLPANTAVVPKSNVTGYFGRVSEADGLSTWRKQVSLAVPKTEVADEVAGRAVLDTVSRSPPPELSHNSADAACLPKTELSFVAKSEPALVRTRSQPKMPAGSAVAFYRDSRIDTVDSDQDTGVNFIVSSELEDPSPSSLQVTPSENPTIVLSSPPHGLPNGTESGKDVDFRPENPLTTMVNGLKSQPASPEYDVPALVQSQTGSKSSDSTDRMPVTPPTHHTSATWATFSIKESPARAPDPEHLKAVWSQASDKAKLPAINSLEGIGDDLTPLPFTLQDVKSEDGETPPPSIVPTRMTMHDVNRAFQQVPSSSSASSVHRVTSLSPSSSSVPLAQRQQTYAYALPLPANTDPRPTFPTYPSPMLSHSPSPAMMYSQLMPGNVSRLPVNGHASVYGQQMWVQLQGPTPQSNNGMMRPLGSPYPAQMVPYPSPSTPAVYGPPAASQNNSQTRGRMPLMSPVMTHVAPHPSIPLYAGSPALMHMQVPQGPTYMPIPPGRRNDPPGHPPLPQPTPPHNTGYTPMAPAPFGRPTW